MLIDMHAHSSGISRCCLADARTVIETARSVGIDGLILCNHYQASYVEDGDAYAFAQKYVSEYETMKAIADESGFRLFFGVEVTARRHGGAHLLLYGLSPDFVLRYPAIYDEPQETIQALVHAEGGIVIQGHPFRSGGKLLDLNYLDGVEVNCHPLYEGTHRDTLLNITAENHLLVTCGGDYHADTYRAVCGTRFPDDVQSGSDLVNYLLNTDRITLHVHEVGAEEHSDVTFDKT